MDAGGGFRGHTPTPWWAGGRGLEPSVEASSKQDSWHNRKGNVLKACQFLTVAPSSWPLDGRQQERDPPGPPRYLHLHPLPSYPRKSTWKQSSFPRRMGAFGFFSRGAKWTGQFPTITALWNSTKTGGYKSPNNCHDYSIGRGKFSEISGRRKLAEVLGNLPEEKAVDGTRGSPFRFHFSFHGPVCRCLWSRRLWGQYFWVWCTSGFFFLSASPKHAFELGHFTCWMHATPGASSELQGSVKRTALGIRKANWQLC